MIRRPINLGQSHLTIGAMAAPPAMPAQPRQAQPAAAPAEPSLAAALGRSAGAANTPSVESGHWLEALAAALEGGIHGRAQYRGQQREEFQERDALMREQKQDQRREQGLAAALAEGGGLEGAERDNAMARALASYGQSEQAFELATREREAPQTRVTQSGTFWNQNQDGTPNIVGRDPNWQPPAALTPQQWGPLPPQTAQQYPNLNPGDMQQNTITGEIRQVPGAAQRQRFTERQQRAVQSGLSSLESTRNVRNSVREALGQVASNPTMTTGWLGARLRGVEGSPAFDLDHTIDTIKANLGFEALSQMRQESPTGGALGQVAVIELRMLQAVRDSLDSAQSHQQLVRALTNVDEYLAGRETRMQRFIEAYEQDFGGGGAQVEQTPSDAGGPPEGVTPQEWNAMTPEERALWAN